MLLLLNSYFFLTGACLGSFMTCCADRLSTKQPWNWSQRSRCPHCQTQLRYWQLIPIIGLILQRGHCHTCHQPISWTSTWIELICGSLLLYNWQALSMLTIVWLSCYFVLIFNSLMDYYTLQVYPLTFILPALLGLSQRHFIWDTALLLVLGLIVGLYLVARLTNKFGLGDVDVLLLLSCVASPTQVLTSLTLAAIGALVVLSRHRRQPLPFVPFISWGFILVTQLGLAN
ncbi:A24 family peptidase [Lactobacillus sp. CBA3606]|uniref:prepilin peptidase n=1 Tax=Lactobacillus sp. CBA3606 TaxID=2099789 RepID=UPI001F246347|nr:prepilin peptidase [Lactobacillus sp. CBA3606]